MRAEKTGCVLILILYRDARDPGIGTTGVSAESRTFSGPEIGPSFARSSYLFPHPDSTNFSGRTGKYSIGYLAAEHCALRQLEAQSRQER